MAKLSNVKHFETFVQGGMSDGQYLNASFTVIAAGPPRLSQLGGNPGIAAGLEPGASAEVAYPIGVVQNLNLSQNRTFNRIWEIGSERSYFIAGRTVQQLGLGRVYYHGPSLLRVLYAYYQDLTPRAMVPSVFPNAGSNNVANPHDVIIPPGFENMYLNLASDLFAQPMGLLLYFRDSNQETVGAVYLEQAYIPNHTLATDSQGTIIQESCAVQFERLVPVAVTSIGLISGGAPDGFSDIETPATPFRTGTGTTVG
jgi:hypothetical protein